MNLLISYLKKELDELCRENVRLRAIGDISNLPREVQQALLEAIQKPTITPV